MPNSGREPLMQYAVTGAICRVVTLKEERYPSSFTKQNAQGLRLIGSLATEKEINPSPLTKRYLGKKLRSKYKMECYLLCFHQLPGQ